MKNLTISQSLEVVNAFFAKQAGTHSLNDHFALMSAITAINAEREALQKQLNERNTAST